MLDAMKMEHEIRATCDGIVRQIDLTVGSIVTENQSILYLEEASSRYRID